MEAARLLDLLGDADVALGVGDDGSDVTGDLAEMAEALALVREVITRARSIEALLVDTIAATMTGPQADVDGWRVERTRPRNRKAWDSEGLLSELARRADVDPETGEVFDAETARKRLIEAIRACVPLTGSLGWRTRALREWGIDPDEWCESSPAPWRVTVTPIAGDQDAQEVA